MVTDLRGQDQVMGQATDLLEFLKKGWSRRIADATLCSEVMLMKFLCTLR